MHLGTVSLARIAGEAVERWRRLIPASVELRTELAADLPLVLADVNDVERILLSLASSALAAMPNGGRLSIALERAQVSDARARSLNERPGDYVALSVSDTGGAGDQTSASNPREASGINRPVTNGPGRGLAMVLGLMHDHNGFLEIANAVGEGTTVRLYFPVPAPPVAVSATDPRVHPNDAVLLVEDEPLLRAVAERSLRHLGYVVLAASDGEEGLRVFEENKNRIRLVFSDAVMPKLGGVALLEALRARGHGVPFIITSGYSEDDLRAVEGESVSILQKPWSFDDLSRMVHKVLAEKNPADG